MFADDVAIWSTGKINRKKNFTENDMQQWKREYHFQKKWTCENNMKINTIKHNTRS